MSHSERNNNEERLNLAHRCAIALYSDGRYKGAEELFVQVMETRRRTLGHEHPHTLTSVSNLRSVLESQDKYKKVERMHRRALEGYEKALGHEHPNTLTCLRSDVITRSSLLCTTEHAIGAVLSLESTTQLLAHVANTVVNCLRHKSSLRWSSLQLRQRKV